MIKNILLQAVTFFGYNCYAQVSAYINPPIVHLPSQPYYFSISPSNNVIKEQDFFEKEYLNNEIGDQNLVLEQKTNSPVGTHYWYKHYFKGLPVYQSYLQASYSNDGKLYSVIDALVKFDNYIDDEIYSGFWINTNAGLVRGYQTGTLDNRNQPLVNIFTSDGRLLQSYHSRLYFEAPDSMVTAMVYLPNPIVASNANYGGGFVDNNDKNTLELSNARSKVRVKLKFDKGKFILTDGIIILKNLHDPAGNPVQPTDTFINFTRDQSGFEDINVFYHLKNYSDYLRKIGFAKLLDTIFVDPHGANGDDNSFLDPGKFPFELEIGTGNVDDGEDGQVVIHEFGHSLSVKASPGSTGNGGKERLAMEEGQADYVAMSYSRSLSKNRINDVFSWDGHNEFWDGFVTNNTRKYQNLTGVKDIDREVWSTALMCMNDKLRRTQCDSIILSSYFFQTSQSTMPQMAKVILKMDSLLFKGKEVGKIWQCFTDRGILDTVPRWLSVVNVNNYGDDIIFLNTNDFSRGIGNATVQFAYPHLWGTIEIFNVLGQKTNSLIVSKEMVLYPDDFNTGIHYLKIVSKDKSVSFTKKIIKF
ncbi:MAG: hypothetical protein ACKVQB_06130 [Bacteroidia bacterium]